MTRSAIPDRGHLARQRAPGHRQALARRAAFAGWVLALGALGAACTAAPAATEPATTAPPATVAAPPSAGPTPVATQTAAATPTADPVEPLPTPLDPCALVTRDEANTLAGVKVLDPQPAGDPPTRCVWPTPVTGAVGQVEIAVGDGAQKAYEIDSKVLHHDFAAVSGVGDEAYLEDKAIFFRKGDTWVALNVVRLDSPKRLPDMLQALARAVSGRI